MSDHAQTSPHACTMRAMAFTKTWSDEVRDAVERMALDPQRLSAAKIHAALAVGAVDGITGPMVPPAATIARWVSDHRRTAREVVGAEQDGTMTHVLAKLRAQLKRRATHAKTAADIRAVAAAAREVAALERDLVKTDGRVGRREKVTDAATAPPEQDDAQRAFLESIARDDRRPISSESNGENTNAGATQPIADRNGARSGGAAAS